MSFQKENQWRQKEGGVPVVDGKLAKSANGWNSNHHSRNQNGQRLPFLVQLGQRPVLDEKVGNPKQRSQRLSPALDKGSILVSSKTSRPKDLDSLDAAKHGKIMAVMFSFIQRKLEM